MPRSHLPAVVLSTGGVDYHSVRSTPLIELVGSRLMSLSWQESARSPAIVRALSYSQYLVCCLEHRILVRSRDIRRDWPTAVVSAVQAT
jgi:hypothetical protein